MALKFNIVDNRLILKGRGDLHLGVLLERMRRDGFELLVSPPEVVTQMGQNGLEEPYEKLTIEAAPEVIELAIQHRFSNFTAIELKHSNIAKSVKLLNLLYSA